MTSNKQWDRVPVSVLWILSCFLSTVYGFIFSIYCLWFHLFYRLFMVSSFVSTVYGFLFYILYQYCSPSNTSLWEVCPAPPFTCLLPPWHLSTCLAPPWPPNTWLAPPWPPYACKAPPYSVAPPEEPPPGCPPVPSTIPSGHPCNH